MNDKLIWLSGVFLLAAATPGPTVLLALSNGSRWGLRAALPGMAGAVLSDAVLIAAVGLGAGALIAQSAFVFAVIKWAGVAYLAWLGLRLLFDMGKAAGSANHATQHPPAPWQVFSRSFGVAVTNPKGYLFFSALLPQFIVASDPLWPQMAAAAAACMAIDAAIMLAYAAIGARGQASMGRGAALVSARLCGAALCLIAILLTGAERPSGSMAVAVGR